MPAVTHTKMLALHSLTTCPFVLRYTTKQQAVVSERPALLQCGPECEQSATFSTALATALGSQ